MSTFEEFVAAQLGPLVRFASLLAGGPAAGEDLVQDVLARMSLRWNRIDEPAAYARRALVNAQVNRRTRLLHREVVMAAPPVTTVSSGAEQQVIDRDAMWRALAALAPRQRAVLVLRYYEDLPERDIAALLGCAPGTVKSQAAKALVTLRTLLDGSDS